MTETRFQPTPLQSSRGLLALYSRVGVLGAGETPLPSFDASQSHEELVLVNVAILRTYEQVIFELERKVLQYEALLRGLAHRPEAVREPTPMPSPPLSASSVDLINSVIRARIKEESLLRAWDQPEES